MLEQLVANNAKSTLATTISSAATASVVLQTGDGAKFPAIQAGEYFMFALDDSTNVEICKAVGISGDTITALRGQEGTTAQTNFASGTTRVELRLTADGLRNYAFRRQAVLKYIEAAGNVTSWHLSGATLPTVVNSQIAGTLTNSSTREQNERIRLVNANSAQNPIEWRLAQPAVSGQKGYRAFFRFGFALVPNSSHFFVGLYGSTGAVNSVFPPTSLTNGIAVGWDNAGSLQGTFLNIYAANSQGPASKLSLGSYFNVNTTAWYEAEFYQQQGRARIDYTVRRLDVSSIADITSYFTTGIPDNSLWLSPYLHGSTMVTSGIAAELGGAWWWV